MAEVRVCATSEAEWPIDENRAGHRERLGE